MLLRVLSTECAQPDLSPQQNAWPQTHVRPPARVPPNLCGSRTQPELDSPGAGLNWSRTQPEPDLGRARLNLSRTPPEQDSTRKILEQNGTLLDQGWTGQDLTRVGLN